MQKTKNKSRNRIHLAVCLILLFSVSITSCDGQENRGLKGTKVESTKSSENTAWVDGLFYIDGQLCQHLRKIYQDKDGTLWFGTNVYDLMRYDGDSLVYLSEEDGVGGGRTTGIVEDQDGNVWFGMADGMTKYDGESFTNFREMDETEHYNNDIWSVLIDRKGDFWLGTNEGVRRFEEGVYTPFPIPRAQVKDTTTIFAYDRITTILEDKEGVLWFGTDGFGITKYDGKDFTMITKEDGLPGNNIGSLMQDAKGNIWIGTMFGGVSKYDGKAFTNYTQDGLVDGVETGALYEDKTGNIWFAVENNGVYRYDGTSFTNFDQKDGLNTNGTLVIYEDREGRFWFGGWGGLFRFDGESFVSVTKEGPWGYD